MLRQGLEGKALLVSAGVVPLVTLNRLAKCYSWSLSSSTGTTDKDLQKCIEQVLKADRYLADKVKPVEAEAFPERMLDRIVTDKSAVNKQEAVE